MTDDFQAHRPGDLSDERLLVGRFDNLVREVVELRGMVERLAISVTAAMGESRELRRELASVIDLMSRLHARFEMRADAADARIDLLMSSLDRLERVTATHEKRLATVERRTSKRRKRPVAKRR